MSLSSHTGKWSHLGKDVVVLHGLGRTYTCTSVSPFVIKLETFLRVAKIKYEFDNKDPFGKLGKTPWITFNGRDITDSQLCLEYISQILDIDLDKNLTTKEKAVSRAFRVALEDRYVKPIM